MFDSWESLVILIAGIFIAYAVVLWLGIIVWTYRDIRERTRDSASQALALGLVVLFNIPGLFLYLVLRPHETLSEAYERRLEAEALKQELADQRRSCPRCQRAARDEYLVCPYCATALQEPCSSCDRPLQPGWVACPFCRTPVLQAVPVAAATSAPPPPAPLALPAEPTAPPPATADGSQRRPGARAAASRARPVTPPSTPRAGSS